MRIAFRYTAAAFMGGALLSATAVAHPHHPQAEASFPSHPEQRMQELKAQHSHSNTEVQHPRPPRQLSPIEFQRIQAQIDAERRNTRLPAHLVAETSHLSETTSALRRPALRSFSITAASCTHPSQLQHLSGDALVQAVKSAELSSCLYGMYNASLVGTALFSDANLNSIVHAMLQLLEHYDASSMTESSELEKLVTFLRAVHWAESSAGSNRVYPASYKNHLQLMFDQYFAGEHFVQFNGSSSRNFMVRYEMLILISSSNSDRLRYLPRFSEAIQGYAHTVSRANNWGVGYEESGMTQLLTHYFNALTNTGPALEATLVNHPEIITNLRDFVLSDGLWLVGHTREYQWSDAVTELGRFLKLGGSFAEQVRPAMQHILSSYSFDGIGGNGWVNAQNMVTYYDAANCHLYGDACDFDLETAVLSGHHTCSDSLKIRYQEPISAANLGQICQDLALKELEFHQEFGTSPDTPVANDYNTDLEVVIFSSSGDYQNYAGTFFNINTNNGGMYLEGTPSDPGNQARFIAFQATWLLPDFVVWNLEHEYIHYLDGRFNLWGGFSDTPSNAVWWSEGLAEYLSQPVNYPNALSVAASKQYQLSELFQTTYSHGTPRIYHWGYLANRYMMEQQRDEVDNLLLPSFRAPKYAIVETPCLFNWGWRAKPEAEANGWYWLYDDSAWGSGYWVWTCGQQLPDDMPEVPDFTPYDDILALWGTRFDADFHDWLDCLVAGQGICERNAYHPADLDQNGVVDMRDVELFRLWLRQGQALSSELDFDGNGVIDQRDVRAMMNLCDLPRCQIAN
ncbi:collagenase [Alkalimonas amylolytica]|uniref:microbial collagenase n=1 Tax=Alkalimonas amylolytica TaxID=152573 RepID=A0A1H4EX43_ALKAM|nr:collagenase [Alkalimonas amylolytica]SEA89565.1 microbial collagenase [Alkalimonas amylolytica]